MRSSELRSSEFVAKERSCSHVFTCGAATSSELSVFWDTASAKERMRIFREPKHRKHFRFLVPVMRPRVVDASRLEKRFALQSQLGDREMLMN